MRTLFTNFTAGEFSPKLGGRVDVQKYHNSAAGLENFVVLPFGCITKRPGTFVVAALKDETRVPRLIDFQVGSGTTYSLCFEGGRLSGPTEVGGYLRFFSGGGIVVTGGTTPVEVQTPYKEADLPNIRNAQVQDIMYLVCRGYPVHKLIRNSHTSWTLEEVDLKNGPFAKPNKDEWLTLAYSGRVGTIDLVASRDYFVAGHVGRTLRINDGNVLIISRTDARNAKAEVQTSISQGQRLGTTGAEILSGGWTVAAGTLTLNAASDLVGTNAWNVNKTIECWYTKTYALALRLVSGTTATKKLKITVTDIEKDPDEVLAVTEFTVAPDDVIFYIDMGDKPTSTTTKGDIRIDIEYTGGSGDTCTVRDITFRMKEAVDGKATYDFAEEAFSPTRGYPECITFFEQRMVLAATLADPAALWLSKSNAEYEDFDAYDAELATSGLYLPLAANKTERIVWLASKRDLWCGTSDALHKVASSDSNAALSTSTAKATLEATDGNEAIEALYISNVILCVQKSGRKIREIAYSLGEDTWKSVEISLFAEHIPRNSPIIDWAWQSEPYNLLWMACEDGSLAGLTYLREQDVVGWHRHPMRGVDKVESLCSISDANNYDQLWLATKRTIDGVSRRFVEYMAAEADVHFMDCGLMYDGTPVTTVTGADLLAGETVNVVADGAAHPDRVVASNGSILLSALASKVSVGFTVKAGITTQRIETNMPQVGTIQGLDFRMVKLIIRLVETGANVSVENSGGIIEELPWRDDTVPMGTAPGLLTGDISLAAPAGWDVDSRFTIRHELPTPCTILCLVNDWEVAS